jgi:cell division septation protein DedD
VSVRSVGFAEATGTADDGVCLPRPRRKEAAMAEEKARAPRARKETKAASGAAAETKAKKGAPVEGASARTTPKGTPAKTTAAKPVRASRKPAAKAPTRSSRSLASVPEPTPEQIAERAYLLWEAGEPGDQTAHWLRAETELRAA